MAAFFIIFIEMRNIILLLLLTFSVRSYACDCERIIGMNEAEKVFEGEILAINRVDSVIIYYEVKFKVQKVIKGEIKSETVELIVPCLNVGCCGIPMSINDRFVVYATTEDIGHNVGKRLYTYECTETKKLP